MPSSCFRRLGKNSFTFHFWPKSFILHDVKLTKLSNNIVLNERMWHFRGSKHTLTPPTYFQGKGVRTPNPHDLGRWFCAIVKSIFAPHLPLCLTRRRVALHHTRNNRPIFGSFIFSSINRPSCPRPVNAHVVSDGQIQIAIRFKSSLNRLTTIRFDYCH